MLAVMTVLTLAICLLVVDARMQLSEHRARSALTVPLLAAVQPDPIPR